MYFINPRNGKLLQQHEIQKTDNKQLNKKIYKVAMYYETWELVVIVG